MYERRGGSVFGAFLLGGLVGAILGLLYAPRPGKETREMLAEKAEDYWGEGMELYNTGKERATEMYETGREKMGEQSEALRTKIDVARERLQEQVAKTAGATSEKIGEYVPSAVGAVDKAAEATKSGITTAGGKAQDTLGYVARKAETGEEDKDKESSTVDVIETPATPEV